MYSIKEDKCPRYVIYIGFTRFGLNSNYATQRGINLTQNSAVGDNR